ncbi:UNVERIFIED_CONTAM: hypothetical protein Sangu_1860800 [Sesamum angustifolium]|uniref:Uncharacterized protein n=1 Tax=Sesamum angustifolium TaxID=2727405 RepID=A0AAW2M9Y5_9LAMI
MSEGVEEDTKVFEVIEKLKVIMALGICRDVKEDGELLESVLWILGFCYNTFTHEELLLIRMNIRFPSAHKFVVPSLGQRIREPPPPSDIFSVLIFVVDLLSIPTRKVIRSYGPYIRQFMPNSLCVLRSSDINFKRRGYPYFNWFHALSN